MYEVTQLEKRMTAFVIPNAIQVTTRQAKYTFASFLSRDTTYDVIHNIWRLARPDDTSQPSIDGAPIVSAAAAATGALTKEPKITTCACSKDGGHYSETALDCILPGTPERIHNLIFASGFIKDFMSIDQKLLGVWLLTPDFRLDGLTLENSRRANVGLAANFTRIEFAHAEYVVYQTFEFQCWTQIDKMRDQG